MSAPVTEKVIETWKEWVRRRWNPEAKFLNLEVSHPLSKIMISFPIGCLAYRYRRLPEETWSDVTDV